MASLGLRRSPRDERLQAQRRQRFGLRHGFQLIALVMSVVTLAGCGGSSSGQVGASSGSGHSAEATPTATPGPIGVWSKTPYGIKDPGSQVTAISCAAANFCAAVVNDGSAYTYSGHSWALGKQLTVTGFNPVDLRAVSCPTTSFCMAVDAGNADGFAGGQWTRGPDIDPSGGLTAVSCATPAFCAAVTDHGSVYLYTGGAWSGATQLGAAGNQAVRLYSVSCPSTTFCMSVDDAGTAFTYSGGAWSAGTQVDNDSPSTSGVLHTVSCSTATFCIAMDVLSVFTYRNGSWSTGVQIGTQHGLVALSCPTDTFCAAVATGGYEFPYSGGTWSRGMQIDFRINTDISAVPNQLNDLSSISCSTSATCVAVDSDGNVFLDSPA
jgi:hypothetical protein